MGYLCKPHRQWLAENPLAANHHYHETMDVAIQLLEANEFGKSVPYLGGAYETATLLLRHDLMRDKYISELNTSLVMFSAALMRMGDYAAAHAALNAGIEEYTSLLNQDLTPSQRRKVLANYQNIEQGSQHCQMMNEVSAHNHKSTNMGRTTYATESMAQRPPHGLH